MLEFIEVDTKDPENKMLLNIKSIIAIEDLSKTDSASKGNVSIMLSGLNTLLYIENTYEEILKRLASIGEK